MSIKIIGVHCESCGRTCTVSGWDSGAIICGRCRCECGAPVALMSNGKRAEVCADHQRAALDDMERALAATVEEGVGRWMPERPFIKSPPLRAPLPIAEVHVSELARVRERVAAIWWRLAGWIGYWSSKGPA